MDNTMKPKTFKAKPWMIAGIHKLAHQEDISDGEWLRRIVLEALIREGYTPDMYFNNTDH
jgi:hypothetical protein